MKSNIWNTLSRFFKDNTFQLKKITFQDNKSKSFTHSPEKKKPVETAIQNQTGFIQDQISTLPPQSGASPNMEQFVDRLPPQSRLPLSIKGPKTGNSSNSSGSTNFNFKNFWSSFSAVCFSASYICYKSVKKRMEIIKKNLQDIQEIVEFLNQVCKQKNFLSTKEKQGVTNIECISDFELVNGLIVKLKSSIYLVDSTFRNKSETLDEFEYFKKSNFIENQQRSIRLFNIAVRLKQDILLSQNSKKKELTLSFRNWLEKRHIELDTLIVELNKEYLDVLGDRIVQSRAEKFDLSLQSKPLDLLGEGDSVVQEKKNSSSESETRPLGRDIRINSELQINNDDFVDNEITVAPSIFEHTLKIIEVIISAFF